LNSAFEIWQRGTSGFTGTSYNYAADRWQVVRGAFTAGMSVSRQTAGLEGIQHCIRLQRNSGNTAINAMSVFQAFESVNSIPFAGKTVTLSFYARAGANYSVSSSLLVSTIHRGTGTDQGASVMSYAWTGGASTSQNNTMTTGWIRYTQTLTLASSITQLGVSFDTPELTGTAGANDWVEITGVQLELGSVATPFQRNGENIQAELAACQRYYEKTYNIDVAPGTSTNLGSVHLGTISDSFTSALIPINFKVQKRVTPAMAFYRPDGTFNSWLYARSGVGDTAASVVWDTGSWPGTGGGLAYMGVGANYTPTVVKGHWAASAEL
jgi:hypothetical protein